MLQLGSLAGAAHLLNFNAGAQREAQQEQKSCVDRKGKSFLDKNLQYWFLTRNRGLTILSACSGCSERCQKSYHRDNWLVAAKRS